MNQVEGVYDSTFGLQFTIVFQNVWGTANDPYTTINPNQALNQFSDYWNANHGSLNRDLVHMWTGKDFESTTIGMPISQAWIVPLGQRVTACRKGLLRRRENLSFRPTRLAITLTPTC